MGYVHQVRQWLEQGHVGQAQSPLPLAHRLVRDENTFRQVLLRHALFFP